MRTETKRRLLSSAILTIVLVVGLSMIVFAGGDETEAAKPEMYATCFIPAFHLREQCSIFFRED